MSERSRIDLTPALIVEDRPATRARLEHLLQEICGADADIAAVATLADARTLLAHEGSPRRFVLVDIGLPDGSGIELIQWLCDHRPQAVPVVVSAWGDAETVLAALRAGAAGYLSKERDDGELLEALQIIRRGGAPIDPFVARRILAALAGGEAVKKPPPTMLDPLTERENEILGLVAHGHNNRRIAELTGLSRFTIEDYTKRIYRKLAVGSRAAAVFEAQARGLLKP